MKMYQKDSKLYNLFEKIKNIEGIVDTTNKYHLHSCILKTKKCPILNDYIDEYLNTYPNKINIKNIIGFPPLILASKFSKNKSSNKTVKILLKHGADVNICDSYGQTPLIHSACKSRTESDNKTVKMLLEYNANIDFQDRLGQTALIISARATNTTNTEETVKILLNYKANVNIQDDIGCTALMYVIYPNTKNVLYMLLKYNTDVSIRNDDEYTPLMYSILSYNEELIKILLNYKAKINFEDNNKSTAVTLAIEKYKYNNKVINIILPTRKKFLKYIPKNKFKIFKKNMHYWKINNIDYKLLLSWSIANFICIINFM